MTEVVLQGAQLNTEDRLPWHKPDVRRLTISVDTQNTPGSANDLDTKGVEVPT